VISSARQFLVEQPPTLTSQLYASGFNAAKAIGSATSTTRTADQTLVAQLFAAVPTITTTSIPAVWQNLTRDLIRARGLTDLEAARLYALINTTFHDALFTSMSAKYLDGFWRPVAAIRDADRDGNPDTVAVASASRWGSTSSRIPSGGRSPSGQSSRMGPLLSGYGHWPGAPW
jgi:hypothetical protein